jgi:hypothetical protein
MKTAAKPTLKISSVSNITQTMDDVHHNSALISEIQNTGLSGISLFHI